jgi:hypothetical protein
VKADGGTLPRKEASHQAEAFHMKTVVRVDGEDRPRSGLLQAEVHLRIGTEQRIADSNGLGIPLRLRTDPRPKIDPVMSLNGASYRK